MKLEVKWISLRTAFKVGLLFHLVTHFILAASAFIALPLGIPLVSLGIGVGASAIAGGILWLFGAAAYNLVGALTGGLTIYLVKVPVTRSATRKMRQPSPYTELTQETLQRRAEREAAEARERERAKAQLTAAEIEERRKWDAREYRIARYNRLQERRREIRDE